MAHTTVCVLLLLLLTLAADASNTFRVVSQLDWRDKKGFYLQLECPGPDGKPCKLAEIRLVLGVADGKDWRFVVAKQPWESGPMHAASRLI